MWDVNENTEMIRRWRWCNRDWEEMSSKEHIGEQSTQMGEGLRWERDWDGQSHDSDDVKPRSTPSETVHFKDIPVPNCDVV